MDLDLFTVADGLNDNDLHQKFKLLRDENFFYSGAKKILQLWVNGFIDRDNKIVKEFQTTFHSVLWELYIYSVLKESNFCIDFSKEFPDFIVLSPCEFNIECVVSEIKRDGDSEDKRELDDVLSMIDPILTQDEFDNLINEAITRHSNSILQKNKKYVTQYSKYNWVKNSTPYAIALGSYDQIRYGKEYYYSMMSLLYGLHYDIETKEYTRIKEITKPRSNSPISVGLFTNSDYENISAVIFSCTATLGKLVSLAVSSGLDGHGLNSVISVHHDSEDSLYKIKYVCPETPEYLSDGLFIFHNKFAKNRLPFDVFKSTNAIQFEYDDRGLKCEGENLPIVGRVHLPKMFIPNENALHLLAGEVFRKYNHHAIIRYNEEVEIISQTFLQIPQSFPLDTEYSKLANMLSFQIKILTSLYRKSVTSVYIAALKMQTFSHKTLIDRTNLSASTVRKALKTLSSLGFVTQVNKGGQYKKYTCTVFLKLLAAPAENSSSS